MPDESLYIVQIPGLNSEHISYSDEHAYILLKYDKLTSEKRMNCFWIVHDTMRMNDVRCSRTALKDKL